MLSVDHIQSFVNFLSDGGRWKFPQSDSVQVMFRGILTNYLTTRVFSGGTNPGSSLFKIHLSQRTIINLSKNIINSGNKQI